MRPAIVQFLEFQIFFKLFEVEFIELQIFQLFEREIVIEQFLFAVIFLQLLGFQRLLLSAGFRPGTDVRSESRLHRYPAAVPEHVRFAGFECIEFQILFQFLCFQRLLLSASGRRQSDV